MASSPTSWSASRVRSSVAPSADVLGLHYKGFLGNLVVAAVGAILILWLFGRAKARGVS